MRRRADCIDRIILVYSEANVLFERRELLRVLLLETPHIKVVKGRVHRDGRDLVALRIEGERTDSLALTTFDYFRGRAKLIRGLLGCCEAACDTTATFTLPNR